MNTEATPADNPSQPQRDNLGRLQMGHRVSVGNQGGRPHVKKMNEYKTALMEAGSPERVAKITDTLFAAACDGDTTAAKLLLEHWCGKPVQGVAMEVIGAGSVPIQTDITQIVAIIQQEEPDPDRRLKIARRILKLGQHPEVNTDGPDDGNGTAA
jgi:predicted component of type VI protein secretion system